MASSAKNLRVCRAHGRGSRVFYCAFLLPLFCAIFLFSLFSDFIPTAFGSYADQRFFQCGLLVVVLTVGLAWPGEVSIGRGLVAGNWPSFLIAAGFLLLSLPFSSSPFHWAERGLFAIYFLAFAILGWRIRELGASRYAVELFIFVAAVACFFYAAMTITVYLFAVTDRFADLSNVIPWGFVNMRYWSHLATWLLPVFPLALLVGPFARNRKWRRCVSFTAAIWWWMVFLTAARGTMLSLALATIVTLLVFGREIVPWAKIFCRFIVFGAVAWVVLSLLVPSIVFEEVVIRSIRSDSSGRFPLWWEAWLMSLQSFPWGQGPQSWLTHELISGQDQLKKRLGHPHNMYLMWAAEYGWMLVAAIFVLVIHSLKDVTLRAKELRSDSVVPPPLLIAFSVSSMAGVLHAGLSAVFIVPASMLVGLCILSLFGALSKPEIRVMPPSCPPKTRVFEGSAFRMISIAAVLVGGVYWVQEVWDYHKAMEADLVIYEQGPSAFYFPRFWFHGNFPRAEQGSGPGFAED